MIGLHTVNKSVAAGTQVICRNSFQDFQGNLLFSKGDIFTLEQSKSVRFVGSSYQKENVLIINLNDKSTFVVKSLTDNRLDNFFDAYFDLLSS